MSTTSTKDLMFISFIIIIIIIFFFWGGGVEGGDTISDNIFKLLSCGGQFEVGLLGLY